MPEYLTIDDYITAIEVIDHVSANFRLELQINGDDWSEKRLTNHVRNNVALIQAREILITLADDWTRE